MLFPLSYEPSLVGVIYPCLERGDVQQGEAEGELHTAPSAAAASCVRALDRGPVLHRGPAPAAPCAGCYQAGRRTSPAGMSHCGPCCSPCMRVPQHHAGHLGMR